MRSGQSQITAQQDEIVKPQLTVMYSQINHILVMDIKDWEPFASFLSMDNAAVKM